LLSNLNLLQARSQVSALLAGLALAAALASGWALTLPAALAARPRIADVQQVSGLLTSVGGYSFTLQTPGKPTGVLNALTRAADRLSAQDYPYVWGGGHRQAGIAGVGIRGPGHNGRRRGYDCSGAVAAVLVAGGLWPAGQGVPNDAGVIRYLRSHGEIAPGAGTGPREVSLYDDPGVHIFMNIDGRFFGTSDGGGGGDRRGGPGWLDDGAPDAHSRDFRRYHFLPSLLRAQTSAGYTFAFQLGPQTSGLVATMPTGIEVRVAYRNTDQGTMLAESVTPVGELTLSGTLAAIAAGASGFTLTTAQGQSLALPATAGSALSQSLADGALAVGDTVTVSFVEHPTLTVIGVTLTATPGGSTTTTTTPTTTTPATTTPTTTTPTTTPTGTTPTAVTPTITTTQSGAPTGPGGGSTGVGSFTGGQGF
jgi:hypothetical protein